jgi:hypothetical protein
VAQNRARNLHRSAEHRRARERAADDRLEFAAGKNEHCSWDRKFKLHGAERLLGR